MLRLTLRTLLAYLDDTLEPAQARDIGKKVAESDFARETVERIKTVTRRRRLSAPPVLADDHSLDPNTIAEYLDNVLQPEQVAELEQAALDNDVRLAEVAACHQILTLVLGEPAKVPPTARRRMYRLVQGPESVPYRQPTAAGTPVAGVLAPAAVDEFQDHEDDLLGTFLGSRRILWLASLGVAVLLLAVAVWLSIPPKPPPASQHYVAVAAHPEIRPSQPVGAKKPEPELEPESKIIEPVKPAPMIVPDIGPPPRTVGEGPGPVKPPDSERRVVGVSDAPLQPLLFQRRDTQRWERVDRAEPRLSSTDALLALPGFHPEIQLDTGVRLQLWGSVPDLLPLPLAESRVTLHVPASGNDADFTLHAGRVFLTAPKSAKPAIVRVRINDEVWDVTLATPDTEVAIDVIGEPASGLLLDGELPESPRTLVYLEVLQGIASVRSGFDQSGEMRIGSRWKWDSKGGKAGLALKDDPAFDSRWSKQDPATPAAKDMAAAIAEMARRVGISHGPFDLEFATTLADPAEATPRRVLAVWMLAAVSTNKLNYLLDALESDASIVRDAAAKALQHWVAQHRDREETYIQELVMKATFTESQRSWMASLVRGVDPPVDAKVIDTLFELLGHERLAIRELARMQLAKLDPVGAKDSNYDALSDRKNMQATAWKNSWKRREGKMK